LAVVQFSTKHYYTSVVWNEVQIGTEDEGQRLCDSESCLGGDMALHCEMNPGDDGDIEEDEDSTDCGCALFQLQSEGCM
jgi:hypothetical protein